MQPDLVIDIGAHAGEDSGHYLERGFRVVAVEANPELTEILRTRFAHAVEDCRLAIEAVGVAADSGSGTFYVNPQHTEFSSFRRDWAKRGAIPLAYEVPCMTMAQLFERHGVPYFLKIDIEGHDQLCLDALDPRDLPKYVSVEAHRLEYLATLWSKGYRRFRVVDQMAHNFAPLPFTNEHYWQRVVRSGLHAFRRISRRVRPGRFPPGSSGPIPDEAGEDEWCDLESIAYLWLHNRMGRHDRGYLNRRSWFDFHATWDQ